LETSEKTNGFSSHINGFMPPLPGEGMYICRNCGNTFHNTRKRLLSEIFGGAFVKCPKCKSLNTERDPKWVY